MAVILGQRINCTIVDGKIIRAIMQQLTNKDGAEWQDSGELPISDDGKTITLPAPGEVIKGGDYHRWQTQ